MCKSLTSMNNLDSITPPPNYPRKSIWRFRAEVNWEALKYKPWYMKLIDLLNKKGE